MSGTKQIRLGRVKRFLEKLEEELEFYERHFFIDLDDRTAGAQDKLREIIEDLKKEFDL